MHDRVPDERHLEDVRALDLGRGRELGRELRETAANDPRQLLLRPGVEHDVGHAAHEVLAEADLRVHLAGGRQHLSGEQVAQVARDGRRADVERDPVRAVVQPGPRARDRRAVVHGDGDRAGSLGQRALKVRAEPPGRRRARRAPTPRRVPLARVAGHLRRPRARQRRPRRSRDARPGRPRSDARRPPCGRPGGRAGSRAERRRRRHRRGGRCRPAVVPPRVHDRTRIALPPRRRASGSKPSTRLRASRARPPRPRSGSGRRCRVRRTPSRGRRRASSPRRAPSSRARTVLACRTA